MSTTASISRVPPRGRRLRSALAAGSMTKSVLLFASAAASIVSPIPPVFAAETPRSTVTLVDAGPDVFDEESVPVDISKVELSSEGTFIVIAITLSDALRPTSIMNALIAGVAIDVDNDPKTGGQGFDGYYGDVPGIEFASEVIASVEDGGGASKSSSASLVDVVEGTHVLTSSDAVPTPVKGKIYTAKVAYSDIGATSGQVIRLVVRELSDRGEGAGIFPEAVLKLK